MEHEIKVIECDSVVEAESEYFRLREEGCWQVVKCMKIVWSGKKIKSIATFTVKKVEKRYDLEDHMRDTLKMITLACEVGKDLAATMRKVKMRKLNEQLKINE